MLLCNNQKIQQGHQALLLAPKLPFHETTKKKVKTSSNQIIIKTKELKSYDAAFSGSINVLLTKTKAWPAYKMDKNLEGEIAIRKLPQLATNLNKQQCQHWEQ